MTERVKLPCLHTYVPSPAKPLLGCGFDGVAMGPPQDQGHVLPRAQRGAVVVQGVAQASIVTQGLLLLFRSW